MKHNIGDVVRIKSKEWYDENKKGSDSFRCQSGFNFTSTMSDFCGLTFEIIEERKSHYRLKGIGYCWTDEMFEDSIEDPISECIDISEPLSPVKVIDWEQRHYEISKDALQVIMSSSEYGIGHHTETAARFAIQMADELVKQLKEREGKK